MKPENAIEVKNLEKSFKVYFDKSNNLKEKAIFWKRNRFEERKVLKGISFEVKKGQAIGLVGHNGCGKSTTLKLLSKIIYPDAGEINMRGRVSSLIELGAGFHPDMSGRENIYTNAAIFGLSRKEIDERIDDIIEFSEIEEFIDNPVRTYSSGMYMRLAFSVAINVDADILLIDEILAVGDVNFQAKCFNKLRQIKGQGTTIVIVSHSLNQIEEICDYSYWIDKGEIREMGAPRTVHRKYMEYMSGYSMNAESKAKKLIEEEEKRKSEEEEKRKSEEEEKRKSEEAKKEAETKTEEPKSTLLMKGDDIKNEKKAIVINSVKLLDKNGEEKSNFITGEEADVVFEYEVLDENCEMVSVELVVIRNDNLECYETNTFREGIKLMKLSGKGKIRYHFDKLNLITGEYWIEVAIRKPDAFPYDYKDRVCKLVMTSLDRERGIAMLDHSWYFDEE